MNEAEKSQEPEESVSRQELEKVLTEFCKWLESYHYMDADWWGEKPNAVDRYLDETAASRILNEKEK